MTGEGERRGGTRAGTGGSRAGTGGSRAGTGGSRAGTGGSRAGAGGSRAGAGGIGARPGGNRIAPGTASARRLALDALIEVDAGARANVIVPRLLSSSRLAERDRGFVTELVYGAVRMQRACDWLLSPHLHKPVEPAVRAALRLGTYQLAFLQTPAHAAVSATVDEVRGPARGLVNAVLRKVATAASAAFESDEGFGWPDQSTELSYPDWIARQLQADLGHDDAEVAMATMNQPGEVTTRADGYIQDFSSQMVARYVGAAEGDRIVDLCAAPGGKATLMASAEHGRPSLVVAADMGEARAEVVAGNVARLGLDNVAVVVADATTPPWRAASFDRVLVDAPCSGLGVLRRRPDARWRIQQPDLARLASLQRRLVESAVGLVKPGGVVVYSVCTLSRLETVDIDAWLAVEHPEMIPVEPPPAPWRPTGRGALLLPQDRGTDGMFVLGLRRA